MSLGRVIDAVAATVKSLDFGWVVLTEPPQTILEDHTVVIYARPGNSTPYAQAGRQGHGVYVSEDTVLVEVHYVLLGEEVLSGLDTSTRGALDLLRNTFWTAYYVHQFNRAIANLLRIRTEIYGPMEYGPAVTFGFRLALDLQHGDQAGGV